MMKINFGSVVALPFMMIGFVLQGYWDSKWSLFFYIMVLFVLIMTLTEDDKCASPKINEEEGKQ